MEYKVINSHDLPTLEQEVREKIADGWNLHGGIAVTSRVAGIIWYAQAMTRDHRGLHRITIKGMPMNFAQKLEEPPSED